MAIILYHHPFSTPSRFVHLILQYLKLDFEIKEIDIMLGEQQKDEFVKINPQHCVPTLVDTDGFMLWESKAIAIYLIEKYEPNSRLYPANDAKLKALINQRLYYEATTFFVRIREIIYPAFSGKTYISQRKRDNIANSLQYLESYLQDTDYFAGHHLTLADFAFLTSLSTVIYLGANITPFPKLSLWLQRCQSQIPGSELAHLNAKTMGNLVLSKMKETL